MVIRLRLSRLNNSRHSPSYKIVAVHDFKRPTAQPIEVLGTYNPLPERIPSGTVAAVPASVARSTSDWGPRQFTREDLASAGYKTVEWNAERVRWWLRNGAQPSDTVKALLERGGIALSQRGPSKSDLRPSKNAAATASSPAQQTAPQKSSEQPTP